MLQAIKNGNKAFARRLIALKATIFTSGNKSNTNINNNNNNNSCETSENQNNSPTPQIQKQQQQHNLERQLDKSVKKFSVSEMSEVSKSSSNNSTAPANNGESGELIKSGWLLKWTNYLKGYQKRWFVLSNGVLSYYRYVNLKVFPCILNYYKYRLYLFIFCFEIPYSIQMSCIKYVDKLMRKKIRCFLSNVLFG